MWLSGTKIISRDEIEAAFEAFRAGWARAMVRTSGYCIEQIPDEDGGS